MNVRVGAAVDTVANSAIVIWTGPALVSASGQQRWLMRDHGRRGLSALTLRVRRKVGL